MGRWRSHEIRIPRYREAEVDEVAAHDLMIRAVDVGVLPVSTLPKVILEWREPEQDNFRSRNTCSLFNAFTEALKGNLSLQPRRTQALHGLMDAHVGLVGKN